MLHFNRFVWQFVSYKLLQVKMYLVENPKFVYTITSNSNHDFYPTPAILSILSTILLLL